MVRVADGVQLPRAVDSYISPDAPLKGVPNLR